jgi:hypothetical protein
LAEWCAWWHASLSLPLVGRLPPISSFLLLMQWDQVGIVHSRQKMTYVAVHVRRVVRVHH